MKVEITLYGKKETIQASNNVLNFISYALDILEMNAKEDHADPYSTIHKMDAKRISDEIFNALCDDGYYERDMRNEE